jgi:hypothetical protein
MTTFESRYTECLHQIASSAGSASEAFEQQVEYMLNALPYIQQYTCKPSVVDEPNSHRHLKTGIQNFVEVKSTSNKARVYQEYMANVEKDREAEQRLVKQTLDPLDGLLCPTCQCKKVYMQRESEMVCPQCGVATYYEEMSRRGVTYDQEVQQLSPINYFAYKKLNHFTEWINAFQGRENTDIPEQVLDSVRAEFKKERVSRRRDITQAKVRAILKRLKLTKYYEHATSICTALGGVPAPKLPAYLEDRLKRMFNVVQAPFEKHRPKGRKNFLSYAYVLYKFCELLGEDEYLKYFPLLKSADKLYQQDLMWKKICTEINWEFIKSI